jgi:hypothetical protein
VTMSDASMSEAVRAARGPVVALVDDGPEHTAAFWSAVAEAVRTHRTLRLVSSYDVPTGARRSLSPILQAMGVGEALARKRLQAAAEDISLLHPELTIVQSLAHTGAVRGLRAASHTAGATLVLDRPGHGAPRQAVRSRWTRLLGEADLLLCAPDSDTAAGPVAAVLAGFPGDLAAVHRAIELGRESGRPVLLVPVRGSSAGLEAAFVALDAEPGVTLRVVDASRSLRRALAAVAEAGAAHVVLPAGKRRIWATRVARACKVPMLEFLVS